MTRLEKASRNILPGLRDMLLELANGDHGFTGTPFARGEVTLEQFLQMLVDQSNAINLPEGYVPQTTFWVLDDSNQVVGMIRMRHCLNEKLLQNGGHIGYYIRPAYRNKRHAKAALALTLQQLKQIGVTRALLTIDPGNAASARVTQSNGGRLDPATSTAEVTKFWIDLSNL